ncbi:hypothetical protein AUJ66_05490 [Candidatus Desantisbacteria bacterium CG1_02_38_46]|uniref:PDZ domain-containing protein n=1 Tax=Candidatus Desantisbacteria bacterium CG1_02_38_46 TaxID=1817893 RepID=A0A1J4SB63_9BACT|nr:MAG: hypothetical protein AUJ66_05490 [Candidatus Desantisbacteria bacterium CG1_02_38_46]
MFTKKKRIFWIVTGLVLLSFYMGVFITKAQQPSGDLFGNLRLFSEVLSLLKNQYVEEVDTQKLIYGAIKGMLASLDDPHTHFMEPQEYKNLQVETQGAFGGLGIEIDLEPLTKQLIVVAPIEGTPAERAGIKAGDKIIEIEGKSTVGITLREAVNKLRGPKGTTVRITIKREGVEEPLYFTITRDVIKLKAVKSVCMLDGNIGYLRITTFNQNVGRELDEALNSLESRGMKGLILDMRNNPGGLLEQAVEVANKFISSGVIVSTKGRSHQETKYFARPESTHRYFPLIVLVNKGSASASEIVTGAIKDNKRGLVLGARTFGKGSVQSVVQLEEGAGVAITTAKYYTPSGTCIQDTGIFPDIEVEDTLISKDMEENELLYILKRNNCFITFAQNKGKMQPGEFNLDDAGINLFSEILKGKNIDFTRQKLVKYKGTIEREIRVELARLTSEEQALQVLLSLDPIVKRALDLMKGVELLKVVSSETR